MNLKLLLCLLFLIPSANAYEGLVVNSNGNVDYAFAGDVLPYLYPNETFYPHAVYGVVQGAIYYPSNDTVVNPLTVSDTIKNNYQQATTDLQNISTQCCVSEGQQNWAIQREAQIELFILRFLKYIFFGVTSVL